jgi:hypothetical protein
MEEEGEMQPNVAMAMVKSIARQCCCYYYTHVVVAGMPSVKAPKVPVPHSPQHSKQQIDSHTLLVLSPFLPH